jgi:hypothetical protein
MNTTTNADQRTQLNFDLKPVSASQASAGAKVGKHLVWVPSSIGSHIGGRWVKVDETDSADTGALNIKRGSAEAGTNVPPRARTRVPVAKVPNIQ